MKSKILILTSLIVLSNLLMAQTDTNVIYHDYNPDVILYGSYESTDSLSIDINQDSSLDFKFYYVNVSGGPYPYVKNMHDNCKYTLYSFINNYDSLNNPSINWLSGNIYWNSESFYDTIGIKIISGSDNYYGWIRTTYVNATPEEIIIDKYAFCKIPNYPFRLGQTEIITSIVSQESNDSTVVYVSDSGSGVVVQSSKTITNVSLTNIQGVVVSSQSYINSGNATISTAGFAHGSYIVQVKFSDGGVYTKQVVL